LETYARYLSANDSERSKEVDMPQAVIATPDLIRGKQSQEIASSSREARDDEAMTTFFCHSL
jgi:hypothetical protein